MTDRFSNVQPSLAGPAFSGFPITPDDDLDLAETTRAIYVGQGGDLAVTMVSGASLIFSDVPSGSLLPLRVSRVLSIGTTASSLAGLV
ncbi:hypothetical protein HGO38_09665 [Rhizobium sp. CG5]|uniref:spike base protein, RCAP_Rcc01079 family n=1 Tax=Rhizobium sp. CG5 TaxID=2726076 RepID=UPI002033B5C7|nr:hypothetical protein [Rhizobium sp. CG5]MCM2473742.1 hypothetical protein [Rhizobium sp. CG5]